MRKSIKSKNKGNQGNQPEIELPQNELSESSIKEKAKRASSEKQDVKPTKKQKKEVKLSLPATRNKLKAFFSAYQQGGSFKLEQLTAQINSFRGQVSPSEFMTLLAPCHFNLEKMFYSQDGYFKWILNELDQYLRQFPITCDEDFKILQTLIEAVAYDEVHLNEALKVDSLKEAINQYCIQALLISLLREQRMEDSPLAFLQKYFSAEQIETLKNTPFGSSGQHFLDYLCPFYIQYISEMWNKGFRPASIDEFQKAFFTCSTQKEAERHIAFFAEIYQKILADENTTELLVFSNPMQWIRLALENPAINKDIFKVILEKNGAVPGSQQLMDVVDKIIGENPFAILSNKNPHLIEKIVYLLSLFSEPLNTPSQNAILSVATPWMSLVTSNNSLNNKLKVHADKALDSSSVFAYKILFFSMQPFFTHYPGKLKKKEIAPIKDLFQALQSKGINQSSLLKIFLFIYSTHLNNAPFLNRKNEKSFIAQRRVLKGLMEEFKKEIPADELMKIVSNFIILVSALLERDLTMYPKDSVLTENYAIFTSDLLAIQYEGKSLPYDHLAYILVCSLEQFNLEPVEKEELKEAVKHFFWLFDIPEEEKEMFLAKILARVISSMAVQGRPYPSTFVDTISEITPGWINYVLEGPEDVSLLTNLIKKITPSNSTLTESSLNAIQYLMNLVMGKDTILLPIDFLKEVAEWQINLQKKAALSEETKKKLEFLYNQCIHKVQNTTQEKPFEEIRTQLLMKFDSDPSKDPQAIHRQENHVFADQVYNIWDKALGETEAEKKTKLGVGIKKFIDYLKTNKTQLVESSITFKDDANKLLNYIYFISGNHSVSDSQEFKAIHEKITEYDKIIAFIVNKLKQASIPVDTQMPELTKRTILDAKKLTNLIAMIGNYVEHPAPLGFRINDGAEAFHILFLELQDQIQNPSCDQGPFMRILIALEVVSEFTFPLLTRQSIHFYMKEYINSYYQNLLSDDKKKFIKQVYEIVEDKAILHTFDSLPAGSLSFLAEEFLSAYSDRLGFITSKEIRDLFFLERPAEYHLEMVASLNQYHQEQRATASSISVSQNANGFFSIAPPMPQVNTTPSISPSPKI